MFKIYKSYNTYICSPIYKTMAKKERIVSENIKFVVEKCEPLIQYSLDRERKRFEKLCEEFKEWSLQFGPEHRFMYGPVMMFLQWKTNKYRIGDPVERRMLGYAFQTDSITKQQIFSQENFDKYLSRYEKDYREMMTWKLISSMEKNLLPTDTIVSDIFVDRTSKGFGIDFNFIREGQKNNFHTETIDAGGYNIQCFHFRYITKIKKI